MDWFRRIPIPIASLALGLAGLGNLVAPYSPVAKAVCGVLAVSAVLALFVKFAVDSAAVRNELSAAAGLAVLPTLFMALMMLATYLKPVSAGVAGVVWAVALVLQLGVVAVFAARHLSAAKPAHVLPTWFLVFVGFVVGSVTSPAFGMESVGLALFWLGLAGYLGVLVAFTIRMRTSGELPPPARPTLAIVTAPPSLLLAGYLSSAADPSPVIVGALLIAIAVSFVWVLTKLPAVLRLPFFPSYAALTFPFVITATAVKMAAGYLSAAGVPVPIPSLVVGGLTAFAVIAVTYVTARYAVFLSASGRREASKPA